MDTQIEFLAGKTLDGKYHIDAALGAGGMGAVYRATHLGTGRPVALKIITPRLLNNADVLERFKREARAAGRLQHPNVVNVTDFGIAPVEDAGVAYLAMELLEGFTLGELLRRQRTLTLSTTVDILEQVAGAIDQAHRLGVVHRDLKPDNIWLAPDGRGGYQVKVLDFGVAAFRESAVDETRIASSGDTARIQLSEQTTAAVSPQLTQPGTVVGTPAYMSPEQCSGANVTSRSDIYSLAVIAYQMVTGALPFTGNTFELLAKHVAGTPPVPANVEKPVAAVILKALSKQPEDRYATATAFIGSIRARSERATMVLRRAIAISSLRFGELMGLSLVALAPALVAMALTMIAIPLSFVSVVYIGVMMFVAVTLLALGAFILGALVFVWFDHVRRLPFVSLSTNDVIEELGKWLPNSPKLTRTNLMWYALQLSWITTRLAVRSPGTDGSLRLYSLIETHFDVDRAADKAKSLTAALPRSMRLLDAGSLAFVVALGVFWPAMAYLYSRALQDAAGLVLAMKLSCYALIVSMCASTLILGPLTAVAYAILYFRACQAIGEDVAFPSTSIGA